MKTLTFWGIVLAIVAVAAFTFVVPSLAQETPKTVISPKEIGDLLVAKSPWNGEWINRSGRGPVSGTFQIAFTYDKGKLVVQTSREPQTFPVTIKDGEIAYTFVRDGRDWTSTYRLNEKGELKGSTLTPFNTTQEVTVKPSR